MDVPVITLKQAEKAVKEHTFKIKEGRFYSEKDEKRANKFEKKHGFRYEDSWNLDNSIALFILPRLIHLRDTQHGFPTYFEETYGVEGGGAAAWERVLNEMIYGFYLYITKDRLDWTDEDKKIWFRTKCWLCRYYENLWD